MSMMDRMCETWSDEMVELIMNQVMDDLVLQQTLQTICSRV
jgi:hypothetical protein